jgi:hypothetical protein
MRARILRLIPVKQDCSSLRAEDLEPAGPIAGLSGRQQCGTGIGWRCERFWNGGFTTGFSLADLIAALLHAASEISSAKIATL